MKWRFSAYPLDMVETDVTQRDQFKNDDVDLADSLGRESTQNSLDAAIQGNGGVTLRFSYLRNGNAPSEAFMRKLFDGHGEHAAAAGIDVNAINFANPTALVIEDFGTKGLTGRTDVKDSDNFSDFWRRHGRSHKTGKNLGRWGLGKLVFSMSSQLNAFFGLTVQANSGKRVLMGQTVLGMHSLSGEDYPSHTFFAEVKSGAEGKNGLPVPIDAGDFLEDFSKQFRLTRKDEPGLSVVIPFPVPDLDRDRMIAVAVANYFIPVLRKQLFLEFDDIRIDDKNILSLAHQYAKGKIRDIEAVFQFVSDADQVKTFARPTDALWYQGGHLTEAAFSQEDLATMREAFSKGELISAELPIKIQKAESPPEDTHFRIFLKRPENISHGQDFYLRGGITVPQEAKFRERKALGLLIADDDMIAAFLGDAENASHTKWNGKAEKLKDYIAAEERLRAIRNSVVELHDHLLQAIEEEDRRALLDFFWSPGPGNTPKKNERKKFNPPPKPPEPPVPPIIRITDCAGGLAVHPGRAIKPEELPVKAVIQLAYDVSQGNPFKLYSEADFDLGDEEAIQIEVKAGVTVEAARNELRCTITDPDFEIKITGFDEKRDLIVRADA